MPNRQCRSRDHESRLRCERTERHTGPHRAETGEPPRRSADGKHTFLPMAIWIGDES